MSIFKMMKQAASMRKEMKGIQKELARKTVQASSGGVTVVAKGDMSIDSIKIEPGSIDPSNAGRLENAVTAAVNNALAEAKKEAGREMSKLTSGMGLPDMSL